MSGYIFVGFGFGPIQGGLFAAEAFKSGNFKRIVISEIDQKLVDAVRANNGSYSVNVASFDGISIEDIDGIEIYNPAVEIDRQELIRALSEATEIVTSLPSTKFYDIGDTSVAKLIAAGLKNNTAKGTIIYTAENNNRAAETLESEVSKYLNLSGKNLQFLNTVIGKMSQVVTDRHQITEQNLKQITPGIDRTFLVEEFNKILVTKCNIPDFIPGIRVFIEKEDLLPFEEAKLYGHNAIHALLAYLGSAKGYTKMADLKNDTDLMQIAHNAFINESGTALTKRHAHLNEELFTFEGYKQFAEDLLERMVNPYLSDTIERATRDPFRKLGYNDRIFGTMRIALKYEIEPVNMALGAAAAVFHILNNGQQQDLLGNLQLVSLRNIDSEQLGKLLKCVWSCYHQPNADEIIDFILKERESLYKLL